MKNKLLLLTTYRLLLSTVKKIMFCPKCGTQNPTTGKFCRSCGTDLAPVSDALAGTSGNRMQNFGMIEPIQPMGLSCNTSKKPVSWESAMGKMFMGLAFLVVSIILAFTGRASTWWFWMLIPAFSILGSGVAQYVQLKKNEQRAAAFPPQSAPNEIYSAPVNSALPPTQADYVRPPQKSIYDTGELAAPPSVTESTTRHLEINSEGETMTLPKK
jgi:hypothetical protein